MPIIKAAIKDMRQSAVRRERNTATKSRMKSMLRLLTEYVQAGDMEKAKKIMPQVVSAVDTAAKKGVIHKKNASHKKEGIARLMSRGVQAAPVAPKAPKAAKVPKAPKAAKKAAAKPAPSVAKPAPSVAKPAPSVAKPAPSVAAKHE